jgi:hypothetical protein
MNRLTEDFAIHYLSNPNEQPDADIKTHTLAVGEIMDAIDEQLFSEIIDDSWEFADQVVAILKDREDDKLGRINDLHYAYKEQFAEWLLGAGNTSVTIPLKRKLGLEL